MLEIYDDQCSLYYRCLSIKRSNWHQKDPKQASAPLILDPTGGSLTKDAKEVCANFEKVTGMRISGQNSNPCTGSLILGSSVLGLRILSPRIEDPHS